MLLHTNKEAFNDLIHIVSEHYGIDARIIEKDYWVSYTLSKLQTFTRKDIVVFRGGTSLTKCYKDLKRFSEDIDLAINTSDLSPAQTKRIIGAVEKYICSGLVESEDGLKQKYGDYRNVEYDYPTIIKESSTLTELNSSLKIETVTFLTPNPYEVRPVHCIIYNYLKEKNMDEFIQIFELEPFELNVLSIKRTLVDKIVSLVRMSYSEDLTELLSKTRHLYDLHLTYDIIIPFYTNKDELTSVIDLVRKDEENSKFKDKYPYEEKWSTAPLFKILSINENIRKSYENNFGKEFVYGDLPDYKKIINTLGLIKGHLEAVGE